jgi:DNA modification methylase
MKIERLSIEQLKLDPNNARKHDNANLEAIAGSLTQFGQRKPIVIAQDNTIVAGNGTLTAAKSLGWTEIDAVRVPADWDADRIKAFALADNRTAELAAWSPEILGAQLEELTAAGFDVEQFGFDVFAPIEEIKEIEETEVPELAPKRVAYGDIWKLGNHRVMCGDSTNKDDVAKLTNGEVAQLLHADPPYGMGKEGDGVANDNLYKDKLDKFQMDWWQAFRPYLANNGSAYIWGNAPELWRLWYQGGLGQSEPLTFRNEITWHKNLAQGINSDKHRMFPTATERCLFFMLGVQGFNTNSDNYWEGWEPLRLYLEGEMLSMGWNTRKLNEITNLKSTASHWVTKSQWAFITKENYELIQQEAKGKAFKQDYEKLKQDYEKLKQDYEKLKQDFYETRAYFDNVHDNMTDVWSYDVVPSSDRHGHATPKPVAMMARVMRSSLPEGGLCLEPFAGSGATLIGAEQTGRRCYTMEMNPEYCDVIIKRWETLTGQKAELVNASR